MFVFISSYAAAQLVAAGKSLTATLGWNYELGAYLSAFIIFLYCFAGGVRASIWTDVVQSIVMLFGMYALAWLRLEKSGGAFNLLKNLEHVDTQLCTLFPNTLFSFSLMFIGFVFSGFGVLGQPHIMVRSMAVNSANNMSLVRKIYLYLGYTMSIGSFIVGLSARIIYPTKGDMDTEMIMPYLSQELFHPIFCGFLLAALFASTISTADSQLLVCASAFINEHKT